MSRAQRVLGLVAAIAIASSSARASAEDIDLECLVEPEQRVLLSAPVEGVVDSVSVDRGDRVERGQVVATLESSIEKTTAAIVRMRANAVAELQAAQARLNYENNHYEQSSQLFNKGMISDAEFDEVVQARLVAEADLQQANENRQAAELELRRAEAAIERRRIRSPIDGVVVRRIVSPGEYADPPQILELAQVDPLHVEVFAPVTLLGRFSVGMHGRVTLENPVGGEHDAVVVVVDPVVDAASGMFGVRLELPNPEGRLPAGVKCRVRFGSDPIP